MVGTPAAAQPGTSGELTVMYLENVVFDALAPRQLGRFWEAALGCEPLTDEPEGYETRLTVEGGPVLDLCFQQVPGPLIDPRVEPARLHLDLSSGVSSGLSSGTEQSEIVDRLVGLGASALDLGQGEVPWVVLADPEGNPFCVLEDRPAQAGTGPLACLPVHSADPDRDAEFWSWLTGWTDAAGSAPRSLRHPSGRGPFLEMVPEVAPKGTAKNRIHLDVRLETGDDAEQVWAAITERGGTALDPPWGELPWRVFADPSGNEFCVLPARS